MTDLNKENQEDQDNNLDNQDSIELNLEKEETVSEMETPESENIVEQKAKNTGHLSKEEWVARGGKPEEYKTEKEFVLTGDLIELRKELSKRDKMIEEIYKYQQSVIQEHKVRARQELEIRLREAKEYGDIENVEALAKEKVRLDIQDYQDKQRDAANEQLTALNNFVKRNELWFNDRYPELKARCEQLDAVYRGTCSTYDELARKVEDHMRFEMGKDPKYAHLISSTEVITRPNMSASKSAANRPLNDESDDKLYTKLSSNEKAMYAIHKRIVEKLGEKASVKEFISKMNEDREV